MSGRDTGRSGPGCKPSGASATLPTTITGASLLVYDATEARYIPMIPVTNSDGYLVTNSNGDVVYLDTETP